MLVCLVSGALAWLVLVCLSCRGYVRIVAMFVVVVMVEYYYCMHKIICFPEYKTFSLSVAGLFSRSRLRGTQGTRPVHHGASVGPGRAPWRLLWAFKVAKSGK